MSEHQHGPRTAVHDHHGHGGVHRTGHEPHESPQHGPDHQETGHQHSGHARPHGPAAAGWAGTSWRTAAQATAHCLTGCAIGEVLGLVIGTALGWSTVPTIALAVTLAFVFGYALTMRGVLRAGLGVRAALKVALAADTISITVMEVIDNAAMLAIPGAMHAGLASWVFWASLAGALALAFVITTPVNRWLISRGRGHAVVHAHHH